MLNRIHVWSIAPVQLLAKDVDYFARHKKQGCGTLVGSASDKGHSGHKRIARVPSPGGGWEIGDCNARGESID